MVNMGNENSFTRLIDSAPHVMCPRCAVEMTLRGLMPVADTNEYTATYRCPKCGTDILRRFAVRG